jgi:hypothetical protein
MLWAHYASRSLRRPLEAKNRFPKNFSELLGFFSELGAPPPKGTYAEDLPIEKTDFPAPGNNVLRYFSALS